MYIFLAISPVKGLDRDMLTVKWSTVERLATKNG